MRSILLFSIALLTLLDSSSSKACTNFIVTKGASVDGSNMISYSADSHALYGELYHWKADTHPEGTSIEIYDWDSGKFLGKINQAKYTYNVVGNMNEFQVAIGETTFEGRKELIDTTGIIDYGSLIYIALQRSRTAREAIRVMTSLVAEYGYYSSGESFSISDPEEVWIMEMIGKGPQKNEFSKKNKTKKGGNKGAVWVAIRIPDGYISGHANQARITNFPMNDPENCLYSPDVVSFARENGYFKGDDKEFSFSDTYDPIDFGGARFCEARVWSGFNKVSDQMGQYLDYIKGENLRNRMPLYIKPLKKLSLKDMIGLMRDYYQGTDLDMTNDPGAGPYGCIVRWRPLTWQVDSITYFNERAISTQQTGFVFVAQSRPQLTRPLGGILWFGVDDTYTTVFSPMYSCITRVPEPFAQGNGSLMQFSDRSAFWIFNQVSNFAYTRYKDMINDIQVQQTALEEYYISLIPAIDQIADSFAKTSNEKAIDFLTSFSVNMGNNTFNEWKKLYGQLFVKYMDGNIKETIPQKEGYKYTIPKITQPGYSESFYLNLIENTGEKFKYQGNPDH